jgi:hypothetical protein
VELPWLERLLIWDAWIELLVENSFKSSCFGEVVGEDAEGADRDAVVAFCRGFLVLRCGVFGSLLGVCEFISFLIVSSIISPS